MSYENEARSSNKTLQDRGGVYGPYEYGLEIRENIMKAITEGYKMHHGKEMSTRDKSHFLDIANKLCRLAITPSHTDSWHDVAGYATLIEAAIHDSYNKKITIETVAEAKECL